MDKTIGMERTVKESRNELMEDSGKNLEKKPREKLGMDRKKTYGRNYEEIYGRTWKGIMDRNCELNGKEFMEETGK